MKKPFTPRRISGVMALTGAIGIPVFSYQTVDKGQVSDTQSAEVLQRMLDAITNVEHELFNHDGRDPRVNEHTVFLENKNIRQLASKSVENRAPVKNKKSPEIKVLQATCSDNTGNNRTWSSVRPDSPSWLTRGYRYKIRHSDNSESMFGDTMKRACERLLNSGKN